MFQRARGQGSSLGYITQASINAGWEGWLAPAQGPIYSTLKVRCIERGQATLPNLHLLKLELFL